MKALYKKGILSDEWKTSLEQMWLHRSVFLYLKPSVEEDSRKLESLARGNFNLLHELERLFFANSANNSLLAPYDSEFLFISSEADKVSTEVEKSRKAGGL